MGKIVEVVGFMGTGEFTGFVSFDLLFLKNGSFLNIPFLYKIAVAVPSTAIAPRAMAIFLFFESFFTVFCACPPIFSPRVSAVLPVVIAALFFGMKIYQVWILLLYIVFAVLLFVLCTLHIL